jgi:hypothetical protein
MSRIAHRGILVTTPDRRCDASQHRRYVMLTLTALEIPRTDAPLAPENVEVWLAHSAANNAAAWELPPRRMERRWMRWEDAWAADPGLGNPFPNSATLLRPMTDGSVGELLDRLNGFYDAASGGPWLLWSPWPTPGLHPYGFDLMGHPPLMIRSPGGETLSVPPELEVVEVADASTLADWQHVLVEGAQGVAAKFTRQR